MIYRHAVLAALLAGACAPAFAEDFPDGTAALQPAQVTEQFSGKVFNVKLRDGTGWRFDFRPNGSFYFNHSSGASDSGEWKVEQSSLCTKGRKLIDASCNEVRFKEDQVFLKRDNGDVVEFVQKR
jgi:hypothetical protein